MSHSLYVRETVYKSELPPEREKSTREKGFGDAESPQPSRKRDRIRRSSMRVKERERMCMRGQQLVGDVDKNEVYR